MRRLIFTVLVMTISVIGLAGTGNSGSSERFDRGIGRSTSVFIPKGYIGGGVSFSMNNYSLGQLSDDAGYQMLFSLVQDIKGDMSSFGVAPYVYYFIDNNTALGIRFGYDRSSLSSGSANLSLGDGLSFGVQDFNYFKHMYSVSLAGRYYMPFGDSKRFAMFAEVRATGGYGQSETYKPEGDRKYGTYQDIFKFNLGLVPGICAFVMDEVALEVSVGVLGFDYQNIRQVTNQVEVSEMRKFSANYKINLMSINLGISIIIPTGRNQ